MDWQSSKAVWRQKLTTLTKRDLISSNFHLCIRETLDFKNDWSFQLRVLHTWPSPDELLPAASPADQHLPVEHILDQQHRYFSSSRANLSM